MEMEIDLKISNLGTPIQLQIWRKDKNTFDKEHAQMEKFSLKCYLKRRENIIYYFFQINMCVGGGVG